MGQREIKQQIEAAVDYLTKNPDEARYTDSQAVARLTQPDELAVEVTGPNGERASTDMPTSVGGTNTAPSPGWYLRAAEASCVATLIGMRAAQQGVTLADVQVTVDSESNDYGILGISEDVPAGPLSARITVRVSGAADAETLEEIVHWAVGHCPVADAVRRAVPMTVEIETGA
jgi:uncharacterized OsmC-like protein